MSPRIDGWDRSRLLMLLDRHRTELERARVTKFSREHLPRYGDSETRVVTPTKRARKELDPGPWSNVNKANNPASPLDEHLPPPARSFGSPRQDPITRLPCPPFTSAERVSEGEPKAGPRRCAAPRRCSVAGRDWASGHWNLLSQQQSIDSITGLCRRRRREAAWPDWSTGTSGVGFDGFRKENETEIRI